VRSRPWNALRRRLAGSHTQNGRLPSLVVGHYQPLADNSGIAPKSDQTGSLQSDQRTRERTGHHTAHGSFNCSLRGQTRKDEKGEARRQPLSL